MLENTKAKEIESPLLIEKHITLEGAYRLAAAILEDAYNKYVDALKTIMKYRGNSNPTIKDRNAYLSALKEKTLKELFYTSRKFEILTIGKSIHGKEVIHKIQEEVGYKE